MLPVKTSSKEYHTLEEIRLRKDQLSAELQKDNDQFGKLWTSLFTKKEDSTKTEWVASIIANSMTAIDAFLLIRKLMKNYGFLFGKKHH